jgi:hypothetical protein
MTVIASAAKQSPIATMFVQTKRRQLKFARRAAGGLQPFVRVGARGAGVKHRQRGH